MRYVKLLGLVVVATAALMAVGGAGIASAETTACKETTSPCTAGYGIGTKVSTVSIEGAEGIKNSTLTSSTQAIHCELTASGELNTATTPSGKGNVTFSNCEGGKFTTVTNGTGTLHHDTEHNGNVVATGFLIKSEGGGMNCYYGGELSGTLTAGAKPVIHFTQKVQKTDNATHDSSFLCPSEPVWHVTLEVKEPQPLYLTTGA